MRCMAVDAVNILAFNSPEWFYAVMGAIHVAGIGAGIYGSNSPAGIFYLRLISTVLAAIYTRRDQPETKACALFSIHSS